MKKRIKEQKPASEKKTKESKIQGNSMGASGFTLGILAVISLGLFGVIYSLVGFVFCLIQQKHKKTKLGKAGLAINVIAFILSWVWILVILPWISELLVQSSLSI